MKNAFVLCLLLINVFCVNGQITPNGLDPSFGDHGIVLDSFANGDSKFANDVLILPNGKILAAGSVLTRYLPSGKPDSTLNGTGTVDLRVISPNPDDAIAEDVHVQNDGKVVIAGYTVHNGFIARFKPNGEFDSSYGTNGITKAYFEYVNCSILQPDGKLIVAGVEVYDVLIRRFKTDGQPDSSFGINGLVQTNNGNYQGNVAGIGLMADGRIVIGGIGYNPNVDRAAMIIRYLPDGRLDTTLNHIGIAYPIIVDYCRDMLLQTDGKSLLAIGGLGGDGYIVRLKVNGTIDSTYGKDGFAAIPSTRVTCMRLLPDNKLLCGGNDGDFVVARVKAQGISLDSSFGQNGVIRTNIGDQYDEVKAVALQQDGKIIAAGRSEINNLGSLPTRLTLVRYLPDATAGIYARKQTQVTISPNPATNIISIDFKGYALGNGRYNILSLDGTLLFSGLISDKHSTINVSDLIPGTYLLSILSSSVTHRQLFTKQ